eukprot:5104916-Pyramimonas_sp.AAC.1
MELLEGAGITMQSRSHHGMGIVGYKLTQYGLIVLRSYDVVHGSAPALRERQGIKDKEATTYELLIRLRQQGWSGQPLPSTKPPAAPPPPYQIGEPKIWHYSRNQKTLCNAYLKCLLNAAGDDTVHHNWNSGSYARLLKEAAQQGELAVKDDDGRAQPEKRRRRTAPMPRKRAKAKAGAEEDACLEDGLEDALMQ